MSLLKSFASFIKENKLDDLVAAIIQTLQSSQNESRPFAELTGNELYETTRKNVVRLLTVLETDSNQSLTTLTRWDDEAYPGIYSQELLLSNITRAREAEKLSIFSFIPQYTNDTALAVEIVLALQKFYTDEQEQALIKLQLHQSAEQHELAESEERYRDLFDNASDLIHMATPEGEIIYVNNAWLNAIGYTQNELKGKSIYSFVVDSERNHFREYRNRVIAGEIHVKEIETCFITKSGNEIAVEGSITCRYKNGRPEYTRGILRNITSRKANEKQLHFYTQQASEREDNIVQLIQNAPDAVIVIDEKSNILLWNPKAEEIFGWSADEVIGTSLSDTIVPIQYREGHAKGMERLLSTGEARVLNKTIEITALHKKGNEFYVSLTISRAKRSGESAFIAFLRDISAQKKNELELEKKRIELEKTNLELEQFAWIASHDLKEPLRKILTFSDMLITRYELSAPTLQIVTKINDSGKRMNELIKGILLYSNVSNERQLFELTDLNIIVQNVLTDLEIIITEKKARITVHSLPTIEAVPFQMRQLFQNLISNSLKYSKREVASVIEITTSILDQGRVKINVKDNGIGFEQAYNEKIFQVFQRLSSQYMPEGTGIGLALCKKITESHGGTIKAIGNEGEGAVFSIVLPLKQS